MENNTNLNSTTAQSTHFTRWYFIPVGFLFLMYILSIAVFWKCKKLAKNVRFWFLYILLINFLSFVFAVTYHLLITENVALTYLPLQILDGLTRTGLLAGTMGTFAIGCEQLCSLIFAMKYQNYMRTKRLWTCGILITIASFFASLTVYIGERRNDGLLSRINTTKAAAWTTSLLMLMTSVLTIIVYAVVGTIANMKKKRANSERSARNNDYSRFIKLTLKSLSLATAYLLLVLPTIIADLACLIHEKCPEWIDNLTWLKMSMAILFYFCLPIILVTTFNESHFVLLMILCRCRPLYKQRLEMKYKQKYATFEIATLSRPLTTKTKDDVQQTVETEI